MSPRLVVVVAAAAILLCCCPFLGQGLAEQQRIPRAGLTTCQLAQLRGYLCAEHWTTTADGFGINIQRIANASGFSKDGRLIPVVLQHGFLDTSATWVLNQAHQSLAFILADSGYDVWLPNSRGNGYSMNSTRFNPGQDAFWAWNFDQMALYDVPATVSYVQYITGRSKLAWISHSQGATISIGAFSKLPSLASGISVFVALAPVTYTAHQGSKLMSLLAALHVDLIYKILGDGIFTPTPGVLQLLLPLECRIVPSLCDDLLGSLFGHGTPVHYNASHIDVYLEHFPAETSTQNFVHWIKNVRSGEFITYDGVPYQPQRIACPTYVFYGTQDYLSDPQDVATLTAALRASGNYLGSTSLEGYAHMDFTWTIQPGLYGQVHRILAQHAH